MKKEANRYKFIMYAFIAVILFLALCNNGKAQPLRSAKNAVSIVFQPQDLGLGFQYSRLMQPIGFYTALTYGNHKKNMPFDTYINDHLKLTSGILIHPKRWRSYNYITLGLSLHNYGEYDVEAMGDMFNNKVFFPLSADIGMLARVGNYLAIGFKADWFKGTGDFNVALTF